MVWNVGSIPAGTGIISDPLELVFQIGITPSPEQVGSNPTLINSMVFTARDAFTKQELKTESKAKNTGCPEDISIGDGGKVQP
jgi:hypothetical protein